MKYVSSSHDPSLRTMCCRKGGSGVNPCCCVLLLSCSSFSTLTNQQSRYKKLKNYVNKEMQKCKAEYYSNLISENKRNPSALWKTLNEITSRKQSSPYTNWSWKLWSLFQVFLIFSPFYLEEMKVLSFSRAVNQLIMRVHKPKVEYKLALQEKPQGSNLDILF